MIAGPCAAVLADEDRTILFSPHNTLDVEQISDQITFIDRGRTIASDNKEIFLHRMLLGATMLVQAKKKDFV